MTEEEKQPVEEKVAVADPNSIPQDERVGTITIVWSKKGQILMSYPNESHIAMKMISVCLDQMAARELERSMIARRAMAMPDSRIIPARTIPAGGIIDPRFIKKP